LSSEASSWQPLDYDCRVTAIREEIAGFIVIRSVAPAEHEILNLAVDPAYRRRGIARALIANVVDEMHGAWFLEVRESNSAAIRLYLCAGFALAGRRSGYYHDPAEAAIVMRFFS